MDAAQDMSWYKPVNIQEVTEEKITKSNLSPAGKQRLREILSKADIARFKNDCGDLGDKYVYTIEGGVHPPVRQYPLNPAAIEEMSTIVKELVALKVIREEANPITNSPIQAVKKPEAAGGGWRPVVNFKALNRRTIADRASLINPQATLKTLKLRKYKSCIDLANGYFSVRLAKASQAKTAFTHKGKSYVWLKMAQGLKTAPAFFSRTIMEILSGMDAAVYIDDVMICDDTEEQHLQHLEAVIDKLTAAGLKLNLKKCQLGQFNVNYLGFEVASDLGLSDCFREKVDNIRPPRTMNQLQKILGLLNYVRDHVPGYQKHAKPLYDKLKKQQKPAAWQWTEIDQRKLTLLQDAVRNAVRLEPRSTTEKLLVQVFCEEDDAMVKVWNDNGGLVSLWSYTLSPVEHKYPPEERELAVLARYWAGLKDLAQGQVIKVITQSQVHRFLRKATVESTRATNARWGRWEDMLLDPDLEIGPEEPLKKPRQEKEAPQLVYEWILYTDGSKKGPDQTAVWGYILKNKGEEKFRQRGRVPGSAQAGEVTAVLEGLLECERRKIKQVLIVTDSYYCAQALRDDLAIWCENGYETAKGKEIVHMEMWKKIAELLMFIQVNVYHQKAHAKEGEHWAENKEVDNFVQLRKIVLVGAEKWERTEKGRIVPSECIMETVMAVHEEIGHAGIKPTRRELAKLDLWIREKEIRKVLRECTVCGQFNAGRRVKRSDDLTIKSTVPWGSICMDVAGPMGISGKQGERYLIVLVDSMSGYMVAKAVRNATGSAVVTMLEQTCCALGKPRELRTDNGTHFKNKKMDAWCQQNGVFHVYAPVYTPQANGIAERTIGLVKTWIAKNANSKEWSTKMLELSRVLNDRFRATRKSPAEELNKRPFTSLEIGRGPEQKHDTQGEHRPLTVGQQVWIKAQNPSTGLAVKPKYDRKDTVVEILDHNTTYKDRASVRKSPGEFEESKGGGRFRREGEITVGECEQLLRHMLDTEWIGNSVGRARGALVEIIVVEGWQVRRFLDAIHYRTPRLEEAWRGGEGIGRRRRGWDYDSTVPPEPHVSQWEEILRSCWPDTACGINYMKEFDHVNLSEGRICTWREILDEVFTCGDGVQELGPVPIGRHKDYLVSTVEGQVSDARAIRVMVKSVIHPQGGDEREGAVVPPVNPGELTRMEGHAWRRSLCEGQEDQDDFDWHFKLRKLPVRRCCGGSSKQHADHRHRKKQNPWPPASGRPLVRREPRKETEEIRKRSAEGQRKEQPLEGPRVEASNFRRYIYGRRAVEKSPCFSRQRRRALGWRNPVHQAPFLGPWAAEARSAEQIDKVIGMTTTGAAKFRHTLQQVRPSLVIVEEAAEVLEAHTITTLSSACQHLILIGDHQQLRPSASVFELAKNFNMEISMFERLVNMQLPFVRLNYQHRMRPDIARLLTPHVYSELENHPSVLDYDNIKGLNANLFFVEHTYPEEELQDGKSHQNEHEAQFVVNLCRYLILQEYKPEQITILTTYTGQLFCLRKLMPASLFSGVKVHVVDKYQGEENDIVLLSLVRSNKQGRVGFLNIPNRVCVALSRAKKGLYCIGNSEMLGQVKLWSKIFHTLREKDQLGTALTLCCQNHPDRKVSASCADDFQQAPEGGCTLPFSAADFVDSPALPVWSLVPGVVHTKAAPNFAKSHVTVLHVMNPV
uniref:ribonuclease H n=1 Tax=Knipowitschia caucasica TaxID=637954 RepID=A0AAV2M8G8_KNICA